MPGHPGGVPAAKEGAPWQPRLVELRSWRKGRRPRPVCSAPPGRCQPPAALTHGAAAKGTDAQQGMEQSKGNCAQPRPGRLQPERAGKPETAARQVGTGLPPALCMLGGGECHPEPQGHRARREAGSWDRRQAPNTGSAKKRRQPGEAVWEVSSHAVREVEACGRDCAGRSSCVKRKYTEATALRARGGKTELKHQGTLPRLGSGK